MTKAKAFQSIGSAAIKVLARLEARKAAKEQFRAQGQDLSARGVAAAGERVPSPAPRTL